MATGSDVADLCGVRQVCSGLRAGIDGSVQAIRELYEEHWKWLEAASGGCKKCSSFMECSGAVAQRCSFPV